jgi:O-antigen ligase
VYWSFPFRFSPHNHYFAQWFNLGLVGLFTSCYLLFSAIARARRAAVNAEAGPRRQLIAFVIGGIAVCGAVFFVELHDPWMYFWMYTGTVMRLVLCAQPAPAPAVEPLRRIRSRPRAWRDSYGWAAAPGRRG